MTLIKGYTTKNNKWEVMTDKELVKHDFMLLLLTKKGECDWDPTLGTSILDQLFKYKTELIKNNIIEDIEDAVEKTHLIKLEGLNVTDVEKGWIFNLSIRYVEDDLPEDWSIAITDDTIETYKSTGKFPLL